MIRYLRQFPFTFLIFSPKIKNKKHLKIILLPLLEAIGSTRFSFPWLSLAAAHNRKRLARLCITVEVIGSVKKYLLPSIQLCPSDLTIYLHTAHKSISSEIRSVVAINTAQGQTLEGVWRISNIRSV
jgi:hypothetical protein